MRAGRAGRHSGHPAIQTYLHFTIRACHQDDLPESRVISILDGHVLQTRAIWPEDGDLQDGTGVVSETVHQSRRAMHTYRDNIVARLKTLPGRILLSQKRQRLADRVHCPFDEATCAPRRCECRVGARVQRAFAGIPYVHRAVVAPTNDEIPFARERGFDLESVIAPTSERARVGTRRGRSMLSDGPTHLGRLV